MTLRPHLDLYFVRLGSGGSWSGRTEQSYWQELELFARFLKDRGRDQWSEVTQADVVAYLARPRPDGEPIAPGTRNRKLTVMRGFFAWIIEQKQIRKSPADDVAWARVSRTERPVLSPAQVEHLVELCVSRAPGWQGARDAAIVTLLFHTGLRVSELLSLDLPQVDTGHRLLLGVSRKGGNHQPLPLNPLAASRLETWLVARKALDLPGFEAVFVSRRRRRLSRRTVEDRVKHLGQAAGLPFVVTPHLLRHSFATELLRTGANLEEVRRLLGHRSIVTTSRYSHPDLGSLRRAVNRLDRKKRPKGAPEEENGSTQPREVQVDPLPRRIHTTANYE